MSKHEDYHYSVTINSDDLAVVGCLRSLSQHSQQTGNPRIPWGGTKKEDWLAACKKVTFRFSKTIYRDTFLAEASRLLPSSLYTVESTCDTDPATPQLKR